MPTMKELQLFIEVVNAGNFSEAARRAGLAPSSVSRQIRDLEESLGVKLINRTTRDISLTEAGQIYYKDLKRLLAEMLDLDQRIAQLSTSPRGTLHLHAQEQLGSRLIAPALPRFMNAYPEIKVVLTLSTKLPNLVADNIDVAIWSGNMTDTDMVSRKLVVSPRIACAGPGYLAKRGTPTKPADLAGHTCIAYRFDAGPAVWRFRSGQEITELDVDSPLQTNDGEVMRMLALADFGIIQLPEWLVAADLAAGRLCRVLESYEMSAGPMPFQYVAWALFMSHRRSFPKVRAFLEFYGNLLRAKGQAAVQEEPAA